MKKLIVRIIRFCLIRIVGVKNVEIIVLMLARLVYIDLLLLAYQSRGILKYWDSIVSGEDFVISSVLKKYFKKENLIVFDVGANVGDYSRKIISEFPHGVIYAFEPNFNTFGILKNNFVDININCYNLGLSSKSSNQKIYTYANDKNSVHASIYKDVFLDLHKVNEIVEIEFINTTIDEFCEINQVDFIDLIKIDTEGHELEVMKGAIKMICENRIGIIQFEFNEMNIISRVFLKDFYEILREYDIYRMDSHKLIPLFQYSSRNEIFQFQNLLAVSKKLPELL